MCVTFKGDHPDLLIKIKMTWASATFIKENWSLQRLSNFCFSNQRIANFKWQLSSSCQCVKNQFKKKCYLIGWPFESGLIFGNCFDEKNWLLKLMFLYTSFLPLYISLRCQNSWIVTPMINLPILRCPKKSPDIV